MDLIENEDFYPCYHLPRIALCHRLEVEMGDSIENKVSLYNVEDSLNLLTHSFIRNSQCFNFTSAITIHSSYMLRMNSKDEHFAHIYIILNLIHTLIPLFSLTCR